MLLVGEIINTLRVFITYVEYDSRYIYLSCTKCGNVVGPVLEDAYPQHCINCDKQEYYVYEWYIEGENVPFYVGKGKGNRAYVPHLDSFGNPYPCQKIWDDNDCEVTILYDNLNEFEALSIEKQLIRGYKSYGIALSNLSHYKGPDSWKINI